MFIIVKKSKIIFIVSSIFFIVFFYFYLLYSSKAILVSSTPISNHVIILDAGHGIPDGGATNNDGSIIESSINLAIVKKIQKLLESSNCTVILTRSDENGIYDINSKTIKEKKKSDMINRAQIANTSDAELFVSIHMNKIPQEKYSGWQTFYKKNDDISKQVALNIQNNLNSSIQEKNARQIKPISNIYLSKHIDIPFVLVECGFLSNIIESKLLATDYYQTKLSWGIYSGILDYFNNN